MAKRKKPERKVEQADDSVAPEAAEASEPQPVDDGAAAEADAPSDDESAPDETADSGDEEVPNWAEPEVPEAFGPPAQAEVPAVDLVPTATTPGSTLDRGWDQLVESGELPTAGPDPEATAQRLPLMDRELLDAVQRLRRERDRLEESLGEARRHEADRRHEVETTQEALESARSELSEASRQLLATTAENEDLEARLAAAEYARATLQSRIAGSQAQDDVRESTIRAFKRRLAELEEANRTLRTSLAESQAGERLADDVPSPAASDIAIDGLREELAEVEAQRDRSQSDLDATRATIAALESQLAQQRDQLDLLNARSSPDGDRAAEGEEHERQLAAVRAERDQLAADLGRLSERYGRVRGRLATGLAAAEETLADRESLESDARSARSSLQRARDFCGSVDLALNVVATELREARSAFETGLNRLSESEQLASPEEVPDAGVEGFFVRLDQRVDELVETLSRMRADLHDFHDNFATGQDHQVTYHTAIASAHALLESHHQGLEQLADRLTAQRTALTGLAAELDSATEADELLQGEVARRDGAQWQHVRALRELEDALEDLTESQPGDLSGPTLPAEESTRPVGTIAKNTSGVANGDDTVVTAEAIPTFDEVAYSRLHDSDLSPLERLEMLSTSKPNIEGSALSDSMGINAKAAFLLSSIDGSVTLGDLIDLSGLRRDEAASILIDLLLDGHIQITKLGPPP